MIGLAGPISQVVDDEECVEIGYRLAFSKWGQGLATEAVEGIKKYVFSQYPLDKVIAIIEPQNVRSIRVAEKVGFSLSKMTTYCGVCVGIYELRAK